MTELDLEVTCWDDLVNPGLKNVLDEWKKQGRLDDENVCPYLRRAGDYFYWCGGQRFLDYARGGGVVGGDPSTSHVIYQSAVHIGELQLWCAYRDNFHTCVELSEY